MEVILFLLVMGLALHALHLRNRVEELSDRLMLLERRAPEYREPEPTVAPPPMPLAPVTPPPMPREIPGPVFVREPEPVFVPEPEGPTLADRIRTHIGGEEWEALIGGSILNKLGALVLVIGIALFLGYSFAHITAAGRAAMSLAVSLSILGAGVWVERREKYRVFARGLIGAGWAALYATAYAIYAIPAARIVDNAFVGSLILLATAAGMILHSLRYRAQAVTGVAYFSAVAALAVTPSSPFAVLSLIPLAASILYLAARFDWYPMALFGLIATYATCISRGSSDAPLAEVEALFLVYWLLFEVFDLLRVKRRVVRGGVEFLYYGNLAGFTGLSYLAWAHHAPAHLWFASACGSALFAADAIARAILRPPSSFDASDSWGERLEAGSFEVSTLVSAVLAAASLVANVAGVWLSAGLALEAETLYLLGVRFGSPFLRGLGVAAFAHSLIRLAIAPWGRTWTPPLVFHGLLFYVNRVLRRPNVLMSSGAAVVLATAIAVEAPLGYLGAAWIAFAVVLFEAGLRFDAIDFRIQAYVIGSAGAVAAIVRGDTWALGIALALVFATAVRTRWTALEERDDLAIATSGTSVALAFVLLWHAMPFEYVALSWFAVALAALELGRARLPEQMRWFAAPAGVVAFAGLIATHSADFARNPAPAVWVSYLGAGVVCSLCAWRIGIAGALRQGFTAAATALFMAGAYLVTPALYVNIVWAAIALAVLELGFREIAAAAFAVVYLQLLFVDIWGRPLVSMPGPIAAIYWLWYRVRNRAVFWLAPVPVLTLLFRTAGGTHNPYAYMLFALALLGAGIRFRLPDARLQSYIVSGIAFAFAMLHRDLAPSIATIALLYGAQGLAKWSEEKAASPAFSMAATALLMALLFTHISGGMLTVSWGLEGLALLTAGFLLRERVLRLEGLSLLLVCILKLFVYDLRNLDTFPRILSFIALGAIMLGVSWIYTRFRNQLRKLL
jgi:hypothetical protein